MNKRAPVIEWRVAKDDRDWARLCAQPLPDSARRAAKSGQERTLLRQLLWRVAGSLLLVVGAAGWWGWRTQVGLHPAAAGLSATAEQEFRVIAQPGGPLASSLSDFARQPEPRMARIAPRPDDATIPGQLNDRQALAEYQAMMAGQGQFAQGDSGLQGVQTADCDTQVDRSMRTVEFQGNQAVTHIITHAEPGAPAYRQTYFYRCTASGWLRIATPDATLWGSERSLKTPSFVYHFRQNDAAAVAAVLARMDILYQLMRRNFGLSLKPDAAKLVIDVNVTQPPGYAAPWFGAPDRISVPSPVLYVAPVELTDADLLAQSIALPLLEQVLAQASERHAIEPAWQPMLNGLYLWQMWNLDLPLSVWREEVVKWIYLDLPAIRPGQAVVLPERYTALCAAHKLWMPSPAQMNIPLLCTEPHREDLFLSPWGWYDPLIHLDQLVAPLRPGEYIEEPASLRQVRHPGQTVALATLIEYAVTTYGRERLPALVAGLGQYESWETLLPAVFGVSAGEFEAGWQAYLVAHYGVPSFPSGVNPTQ
jgi:hypothetical protein